MIIVDAVCVGIQKIQGNLIVVEIRRLHSLRKTAEQSPTNTKTPQALTNKLHSLLGTPIPWPPASRWLPSVSGASAQPARSYRV